MKLLRAWIRDSLLKFGWDVRRTSSYANEARVAWRQRELAKWRLIKLYSPATVLDIGANTGQFASLARELIPGARIISFEPLRDCYEALLAQSLTLTPHEVFPYALGESDGVAIMEHNEFSPSSSLLSMELLHKEELPHTAKTVSEEIQLRRLDSLTEAMSLVDPLFIKIDVQGYTAPVLRGGERTVRRANAIVAEISVQPLYHGEATFSEVYSILTSWGFEYRGNVDQWCSERDGRVLQCDCLFEKVESQ